MELWEADFLKFSRPIGKQERVLQTNVDTPKKPAVLDVASLYDEHADFIGRILLRLLGDGNHVDDLLQETFIIAFEKRETFDAKRAAARTWLYGIAANLSKHHKRGAGRMQKFKSRLTQETTAAHPTQPDGELEREQDIAIVQSVIESLAFKQREVFVLFELEGLSGKEIAVLLRIPLGTVWTRLHEARNRFREALTLRMGKEMKSKELA